MTANDRLIFCNHIRWSFHWVHQRSAKRFNCTNVLTTLEWPTRLFYDAFTWICDNASVFRWSLCPLAARKWQSTYLTNFNVLKATLCVIALGAHCSCIRFIIRSAQRACQSVIVSKQHLFLLRTTIGPEIQVPCITSVVFNSEVSRFETAGDTCTGFGEIP
ncbi:hypothetical protein D3C75_876700 [compost metagenome]